MPALKRCSVGRLRITNPRVQKLVRRAKDRKTLLVYQKDIWVGEDVRKKKLVLIVLDMTSPETQASMCSAAPVQVGSPCKGRHGVAPPKNFPGL